LETRRPGVSVVSLAAFLAALGLAGASAFFSISGLTTIFAGAFLPVIALGAVFEVGKLSAVAWLGQGYAALRALKVALVVLVAVLMALNSIGVYGFLSRAHIQHALAGDLAVAQHEAEIDARITVQAGVLADLDRRIAQIDAAIDETTKHGR